MDNEYSWGDLHFVLFKRNPLSGVLIQWGHRFLIKERGQLCREIYYTESLVFKVGPKDLAGPDI